MITGRHLKIKKYILIGVAAAFFGILIIITVPFFFKDSSYQVATPNLHMTSQQKKILKMQDKLIEASKSQADTTPSNDELKRDSERLIEEAKANNGVKSQEEIQKDMDNLINANKK